MTYRFLLGPIVLSCWLGIHACGSATDGASSNRGPTGQHPGGTNEVTESDIDDVATAMCALYERCDLNLLHLYGRGEECVMVYRALLERALETEASVDPRTLLLYQRVGTCEALTSAACPEPGLGAFLRFLSGIANECASGLLAEEGEACPSGGGYCKNGLRCSSQEPNTCGTCETAPSGWCENDTFCPEGQSCDATTHGCRELSDLGEACDSSTLCQVGDCHDGVCAVKPGAGSSCDSTVDCDNYLTCRDGICQPPGGLGDPCDDRDDCRAAFACVEGTCETPQRDGPLGAACRPGFSDCGKEAYCEPAEERCRSNALGATCNQSCGAGRRCQDGACADLLEKSEQCSGSYECATGKCLDDVCVEPVHCR